MEGLIGKASHTLASGYRLLGLVDRWWVIIVTKSAASAATTVVLAVPGGTIAQCASRTECALAVFAESRGTSASSGRLYYGFICGKRQECQLVWSATGPLFAH